MRKSRFTEAQIIGMIKEQEAGNGRSVPQHMAEAQFSVGIAIPGRGAELPDPRCMRRLDGGCGLSLRNDCVHITETRPTHAKLGDLERGVGDLAGEVGVMTGQSVLIGQIKREARPNAEPSLHPSSNAQAL